MFARSMTTTRGGPPRLNFVRSTAGCAMTNWAPATGVHAAGGARPSGQGEIEDLGAVQARRGKDDWLPDHSECWPSATGHSSRTWGDLPTLALGLFLSVLRANRRCGM